MQSEIRPGLKQNDRRSERSGSGGPTRGESAPPEATTAGPTGCSNMKLRRLARIVSRHYDAHLALCGLKTTQYSLLATVAHAGPLQQSEIARLLSLDASTLTRNLRPLVDAGLLVVEAGLDGRSRQVSITAAGRERRAQARRHWKRAQLDFNDAVGSDRVGVLHEVVDACHDLLAARNDSRGGHP